MGQPCDRRSGDRYAEVIVRSFAVTVDAMVIKRILCMLQKIVGIYFYGKRLQPLTLVGSGNAF